MRPIKNILYLYIKQNVLFFGVLLTVHLSIFFSVFNQLDAQNLFHNTFILCNKLDKYWDKNMFYIDLMMTVYGRNM